MAFILSILELPIEEPETVGHLLLCVHHLHEINTGFTFAKDQRIN